MSQKIIIERCKGCYATENCLFLFESRKFCGGPFESVQRHMEVIKTCVGKSDGKRSSSYKKDRKATQ
ncbi:MAG TPA: hypothetical protein DHV16_00545 [Nitrospiraceae bacterium]|nr:MAG: hypothetical protein A2Z82_09900 [Nitrospirae bacterium GWA2_46_11]OGW23234.1 MAG: hypothetical protein A2X55_09705 [Nitrospirae bacterium GWB2_47_37]HAK89610.1 hypothetical protein [Nitrospiraceae bacterium]HCZ10756.1 hypothetical protein [Nitrospiraceae bacterium]